MSQSTDLYVDRLNEQLQALKTEQGLDGVAFFPVANLDLSIEDIAKDASGMIDAYKSGAYTDISDIKL